MRNTPFAHMTVPISVQTNRLRILSNDFQKEQEEKRQEIQSKRLKGTGRTRASIQMAPHGMIVTCMATAGRTHDSPIFGEMYGRVPRDGSSSHVVLDAAYLAKTNCDMIARSGCRPPDPRICGNFDTSTHMNTSKRAQIWDRKFQTGRRLLHRYVF